MKIPVSKNTNKNNGMIPVLFWRSQNHHHHLEFAAFKFLISAFKFSFSAFKFSFSAFDLITCVALYLFAAFKFLFSVANFLVICVIWFLSFFWLAITAFNSAISASNLSFSDIK